MKNSYDTHMKEVWEMKKRTYRDFKKSGLKNFTEFIRKETKNKAAKYRKQLHSAA